MDRTDSATSVLIIAQHRGAGLSKGQKTFNTLIKQIEANRALLRSWEQVNTSFRKMYVEELLPLEQRFSELKRKMAHSLDQAWNLAGLTKPEKRMVAELITGLVDDMLAENDDDTDLKALYNKHSGSDFDAEMADELDEMKMMAEALLDIDMGEDDVKSSDDFMQRLGEAFAKGTSQATDETEVREQRKAKKKKSPKQLAAEARQQAEQAEISTSIREVYRKLAVALHPDREPDPEERVRKTELMQRANLAYNQKNLLQLLELQLELEHIDQHAINNLGEDRLRHYNKVLKEQLDQLKREISEVENASKFRFDLDPFTPLSPATAMRNLTEDVRDLKADIRELDKDLRVFADVRTLKMWLKNIKRTAGDFRREEIF